MIQLSTTQGPSRPRFTRRSGVAWIAKGKRFNAKVLTSAGLMIHGVSMGVPGGNLLEKWENHRISKPQNQEMWCLWVPLWTRKNSYNWGVSHANLGKLTMFMRIQPWFISEQCSKPSITPLYWLVYRHSPIGLL